MNAYELRAIGRIVQELAVSDQPRPPDGLPSQYEDKKARYGARGKTATVMQVWREQCGVENQYFMVVREGLEPSTSAL
jgi:hypothetical protein